MEAARPHVRTVPRLYVHAPRTVNLSCSTPRGVSRGARLCRVHNSADSNIQQGSAPLSHLVLAAALYTRSLGPACSPPGARARIVTKASIFKKQPRIASLLLKLAIASVFNSTAEDLANLELRRAECVDVRHKPFCAVS